MEPDPVAITSDDAKDDATNESPPPSYYSDSPRDENPSTSKGESKIEGVDNSAFQDDQNITETVKL